MSDPYAIHIVPPDDEARLTACARIALRSFLLQDTDTAEWITREGRENIRIACRDQEVVGGLTIQRMGQWFGGRSVPMVGIRGVAVAPHFRGRGVATELLRVTLKELSDERVPISALYPGTQPVYRRAGYELAGTRTAYRLPTQCLAFADRSLTVRPVQFSDYPAIHACYTQGAMWNAGNLDRGKWSWARLFDPPSWHPRTDAYLAERDARVEGFVVFGPKAGASADRSQELEAVDLVATTPQARRCLLTLLGDHRAVADRVTIFGAPADPLLYLPAEQCWTVASRIDWMLRIVDVRKALEARGYAPGMKGEIHLEVTDDLLPRNAGRFLLEICDSKGHVSEGGRGTLHADIRGLASLYTGYLSPGQLRCTGLVEGSREELALAGTAFAGSRPWMSDMF